MYFSLQNFEKCVKYPKKVKLKDLAPVQINSFVKNTFCFIFPLLFFLFPFFVAVFLKIFINKCLSHQ